MVDPSLLVPNPWNANVMSPENEDKLEKSMLRHGAYKPIIVRQNDSNQYEIVGGEHRARIAKKLNINPVMIVNLGRVSDTVAKEIMLVDNSRYGADDTLKLAEVLESIGDIEDISSFMPYTDADLVSIFSSVNIALDELDLDDSDEFPVSPQLPLAPTHQFLRFKVPIEDAEKITALFEKIMKQQGFTQEDSLANAGDALVYLCHNAKV